MENQINTMKLFDKERTFTSQFRKTSIKALFNKCHKLEKCGHVSVKTWVDLIEDSNTHVIAYIRLEGMNDCYLKARNKIFELIEQAENKEDDIRFSEMSSRY